MRVRSRYANPDVKHSRWVLLRRRSKVMTLAVVITANALSAQPASPSIPKQWQHQDIVPLEVPPPEQRPTPPPVSTEYQCRIPVRPIFRNYARYRPGKEDDQARVQPAGAGELRHSSASFLPRPGI